MTGIFRVLIILSALTVITTVSATNYEVDEDGILVLTDDNLAQTIEEFEYIFVKFYPLGAGIAKRSHINTEKFQHS